MRSRSQNRTEGFLRMAGPPVLVTTLLWATRLNDVTPQELLLACALFGFAWVPFCRWRARGGRTLPVFPMLAAMYFIYYVLPLFWGERVTASFGRARRIPEDDIERTMLFVALGVACLWTGMRCGVGRRLVPQKVLDFKPSAGATWHYVRLLALLSIPFAYFMQSGAYVPGSGLRQVMMIAAGTVPLVVLVLLFRRFLRKQASHLDVLLLVLFLGVKFLAGISSGWVGAGTFLMIVCAAVYLSERRKIPVAAVLLVIVYALFFQAGKMAFRKAFWGERVDSTFGQRVSFWTDQSLQTWELTLRDRSGESWRRMADQNLDRVSLLQQTTSVLEMTPEVVPYQLGKTYSYVMVTLIPRALWPDKPSVNDANRFYQVAYGLTAPENLDSVSIAVGTLAESYMNFGWFGLPLIMFPLGIFFDVFEHMFLPADSGWMFNAIGVALIPGFLGIEGQLAGYVGGIVQAIFMTLVVFTPVLSVQPRQVLSAARNHFGAAVLDRGTLVRRIYPAFRGR